MPLADVTDFLVELFEQARKKSGRNFAEPKLINWRDTNAVKADVFEEYRARHSWRY